MESVVNGLEKTTKNLLSKAEQDTETEKKRILPQVLEILETASLGSLEALRLYAEEKPSETAAMLDNLSSIVGAVRAALTPIEKGLEHSYMTEMLDNLDDTIQSIQKADQAGQTERVFMLLEFQLFPFFQYTREQLYFWGMVYPDKQKMDDYYVNEFAEHYRNPYISEEEPSKYWASVVIPAYNHLETTKQCVEHILKYTDFDALNMELILIDHGSSDGTLEYFQSVGVYKVIHFKNNVRMGMFATMFRVCEGKNLLFVSNDILVTKDWASLLVKCVESDERIIAAVPNTPNICNLQMLNPPTNDPEKFEEFANKHNQYNPALWNDRARLMPPMCVYDVKLVNRIGFADPLFYTMEFWDDDFSARARRAGYRQIICDDVACYHFGSVTGKEFQVKESTLQYGRELFRNKHNVDAWGTGFCYDYNLVQILTSLKIPSRLEEYHILGIDNGFGDTPLQIRNILRHNGLKGLIYTMTYQKEYLPDLKQISDDLKFVDSVRHYPEAVGEYTDNFFDFICFDQDISQYPMCLEILKALFDKLRANGKLAFRFANPFFALTLSSFIKLDLSETQPQFLSPGGLRDDLQKIFPSVSLIPLKESVKGIEGFVKRLYGNISNKKQVMDTLTTKTYYVVCQK